MDNYRFLQYINTFLYKQLPKCSDPSTHSHPGIVECHPKPPLPGSWHKDPKIRHTKESMQQEPEEEKYSIDKKTAQKLATFIWDGLDDDEQSNARMLMAHVSSEGELTPEDKIILDNMKALTHSLLERIHETLSNPIDNIMPFDISREDIDIEEHKKYFASILDQYNIVESAGNTKQHIAKELSTKLRGNVHFEALAKHIKETFIQGRSINNPNIPAWMQSGTGEWSFPGKDDVESCVAELIYTWAVSSADHNELAIILQYAVAEEFELEEYYESSLVRSGMGSRKELDQHGKGYRVFARAVYDHTQEWFKKHNIDSVILHRGMALQPEDMADPDWHIDDAGETSVTLQPMSSFSTNEDVAYDFSGMRARGEEEIPIILSARVPIDKIIATAQTGWGCKEEAEMVVLGGTYKMSYYQPTEKED